jgi:hypothetical protein
MMSAMGWIRKIAARENYMRRLVLAGGYLEISTGNEGDHGIDRQKSIGACRGRGNF